MDNVTMDQKLQLVQQIRSRYQEDQYDLSDRERVLYGRTSYRPERENNMPPYSRNAFQEDAQLYREDGALSWNSPLSFLKVRFLFALLLLAAVILMDKNSLSVAGITSEKIFQMISADYEEKLGEWAETISR